jgi:hypothetical protein
MSVSLPFFVLSSHAGSQLPAVQVELQRCPQLPQLVGLVIVSTQIK